MKEKKVFRLWKPVLLWAFLWVIPAYAIAQTFSLSVTPYEGGYDLRYGKIDAAAGRVNKEVSVGITSDLGRQYRLVQAIVEPLSTTDGNSIPQHNLVVYAIRGGNKYGTLNVEQEVPLTLGTQVLYTSNGTGTSDSFTLVYSLINTQEIQPGYYTGRIRFTLEPIDSSQNSVTTTMNIFAELEVESTIEIKTSRGARDILLDYGREEFRGDEVLVDIKGGFGKQFRILQVITEQPVSPEGNLLGWEAVNFLGRDAQKGIVINEPTPISTQQQIIYTSSTRGEADTFTIQYNLGDLAQQKAGNYRTKIKYLLEGVGFAQIQLIDTLGLEIENPRVFDLIVKPELGGVIQFRELKPLQPPRMQEVIFTINTNIGRQYQVTQDMKSLLTSKEGKVIPGKYFTLKEESLETKGMFKYPEKTEVKEGQMVLFVSDKEGSSDKFRAVYELETPGDIHYGDYSTTFTYLISEI